MRVMNSFKKANSIIDYKITLKKVFPSQVESNLKISVFFSNTQNEHGQSNSNENPLKCKIMIKWCTNTTRQTLFLQQQQYFFPRKGFNLKYFHPLKRICIFHVRTYTNSSVRKKGEGKTKSKRNEISFKNIRWVVITVLT